MDFTRMGLCAGDICVSWSSWFVSLLIWLKDGIKNAPSHNMHVHTSSTIASAEANGYKKVDLNEALNKPKRVMIFRFLNMTDFQTSKLQRLSIKYFKKKYDYSSYFIVILRIMLFFIPVMVFLVLKSPLFYGIGLFVVLLILYFPIMKKLKEWEKVTVHCSEAEGELYSVIGLLRGVGDETNLAPHIWLWILQNRPDVQLILDTQILKSKYAKANKK